MITAVFIAGFVASLFIDHGVTRIAHAYSSGPPAGFTVAPGEFTCAECHTAQVVGLGKFTITAPQTYVPGQTYQITVTHTNSDPTRKRWGFELTALADDNSKAGNLQSLNGLTQVLDNQGPGNSRQYIEHTSAGTFFGQTGGASWTFNWTAPPTEVGQITFFAAGNQANGDSLSSGDYIYSTFVAARPAASGSLQFSASSYSVNKSGGGAPITVTRLGDTSGAVAVDYATGNGTASDSRDYTPAFGTLSFAAGEASKTFNVLIIDNAYVEGTETVNLTLSNPVGGAVLANPSTAALTIIDNNTTPPTTNPLDQAQFFVRQHYLDFLSRDPDAGGFAYWTNQIAQCGTDASCLRSGRVAVSAAFFTSTEFQDSGYFVYRFYKAGYGRKPTHLEFIPDRSRVVGGPDLEASKQAYASGFVTRPAFTAQYPASITAEQYVDSLNGNTGGSLTPTEHDALVSGLKSGAETRATVLRKVADNAVFRQREFNAAFVLMQYFGYLRREPDQDGYNFWLSVLNDRDPNNFKGMVCAFITSAEYQLRFSPIVPHSNTDCGMR